MKQPKFTMQEICNFILDEYIVDQELNTADEVLKSMPVLIENGLAFKMTGTDDVYYSTNTHKILVKFLLKYNKRLENYHRQLFEYEFGGAENKYAKTDERLIELSQYTIEPGTYAMELKKKHYALLIIEETDEDSYSFKYTFYVVGPNCKKWKKKVQKEIDKYRKIRNEQKSDLIMYLDGRPHQNTIFKSFDQVIMRDKKKYLTYVDNWVNNIPDYYKKYQMIPKLSIILYGKPGTGKSTFCKALADYLHIDTVTMIQPDYFRRSMGGEGNQNRKMMSGRVPTIISIDDIDCVCDSRENAKDKENGQYLSTLLSFLDTPPTFDFKAKDGLHYPVSIVVATTNYFDKLDDAVKRHGRFDLQIEMHEFDRKEAQEMCDIYGLDLRQLVDGSEKKDFVISPSKVQALCFEHLDLAMKTVTE